MIPEENREIYSCYSGHAWLHHPNGLHLDTRELLPRIYISLFSSGIISTVFYGLTPYADLYILLFSWWWAMCCPKHVETEHKWNIYLLTASGWCFSFNWGNESSVPREGMKFFSFPNHPDHFWGPFKLNYLPSWCSQVLYLSTWQIWLSDGANLYICTYRVIQEESALLWEMIVWVILSKKVHTNMGPILNSYGVMGIF